MKFKLTLHIGERWLDAYTVMLDESGDCGKGAEYNIGNSVDVDLLIEEIKQHLHAEMANPRRDA
jgi:hypothetical protein